MNEQDRLQTEILMTPAQAAMVEAFKQREGMPSQATALELLIDIALETVTGSGRRFWDKPIIKPPT